MSFSGLSCTHFILVTPPLSRTKQLTVPTCAAIFTRHRPPWRPISQKYIQFTPGIITFTVFFSTHGPSCHSIFQYYELLMHYVICFFVITASLRTCLSHLLPWHQSRPPAPPRSRRHLHLPDQTAAGSQCLPITKAPMKFFITDEFMSD